MTVPVHIKPSRVSRILTPFQYIQPQRIVRSANPHMIRNVVEDMFEAILTERTHHSLKPIIAAQLCIQRIVVRDVVAMFTVRPGLQVWRRVKMTDAQLRQVRCQRSGIIKSKLLSKLHAIGSPRNHEWMRTFLGISAMLSAKSNHRKQADSSIDQLHRLAGQE